MEGSCGPGLMGRVGFRDAWLGQEKTGGIGVIVENLRVSPPGNGGFKLPFDFILAEVLFENVVKEFFRKRPVRLDLERMLDLAKRSDMLKRCPTEKNFSLKNIGFGKRLPLRSNLHIAFFHVYVLEERTGVDDWKEV